MFVERSSTAVCSINGSGEISSGPLIVRTRGTWIVAQKTALMYYDTMLTLTGDFGPLLLDSSIDNPASRFALANGLCGNLAEAILEIDPTRSIYFVSYEIDDETELEQLSNAGTDAFLSSTTHVVVTSSDGLFLDSYGIDSRSGIESFYDGTLIRGSRVMLRNHYVTDAYTTDRNAYSHFATSAISLEDATVRFDRGLVA